MRQTFSLEADWAVRFARWEDAPRTLCKAAEQIGVLVATSSVVGLNNHRPLDPQDFRGFVLCDRYAPLVFVNGGRLEVGADVHAADRLAHLWLGQDGLFNLINMMPHADATRSLLQ